MTDAGLLGLSVVGWVYSPTASAIGRRIDDTTYPVGEYAHPTGYYAVVR